MNTFSVAPSADGVEVTSTIDMADLINEIDAADSPEGKGDSYFTTSGDFQSVVIDYQHEDGRQQKRIKHRWNGDSMEGTATWSTSAKTGEWLMIKVKSYDTDGALNILHVWDIGGLFDITIT